MSSNRHHGWAGSATPEGTPLGGGRQESETARACGRREFAAGLALAGVALFAGVRRATADDGDPVKERLIDFKNFVCEISQYVEQNGLQGPLQNQEDIDYIVDRIYPAAWYAQKLLNRRWSAVFAPPALWLHWMPPDAAGMTLQEVSDQACHDACEALERYCEEMESGGEDYEPAAHALWLSAGMLCHIIDLAGL